MPYFISTYGSTQKQVVIVLMIVPRNTTRHAMTLHENQRRYQVDDRFRHRFVSVMPKQPHSLAELQVDLPHAADVKLHDQHQHDPHRKQIAFSPNINRINGLNSVANPAVM